MPGPRYVLSARAADALRALIAPGSGYGARKRPILPVSGAIASGHQWRIFATANDDGSVSVSAAGGIVAWGAGINYANPGDGELGALVPGQSARVVWATSAAPVPLVNDPRWPDGDAPKCNDRECDCPQKHGDPSAGGGDGGALLLVPDEWTAPRGITDVREIGSVSVSAAGAVTISQLQRDTIVARAIVGRGEGGGDKPDETPPCGHPLNGSDATGGTHPMSMGGDGGAGQHPLDSPGDGGYTPLCADDETQAA